MKLLHEFIKKSKLLNWIILVTVVFFAYTYLQTNPELSKLTVRILLVISLYAATVIYSVPLKFGYAGLTPIAALATIYDPLIEQKYIVWIGLLGMVVAEIGRTIWTPYQKHSTIRKLALLEIVIFVGLHLLDLGMFILMETPLIVIGNLVKQIPYTDQTLSIIIMIYLLYFVFHFIIRMIVSELFGFHIHDYFRNTRVQFFSSVLFSLPLILLIRSANSSAVYSFAGSLPQIG